MLGSKPALAQATEFSAPAACPSRDALLELVHERLPMGVDKIPAFGVKVQAKGRGFRGTLELGRSAPRELRGETCVEVLEAMAIILVLRAERQHEEEQAESGPAAAFLAEPLPTESAPEPSAVDPVVKTPSVVGPLAQPLRPSPAPSKEQGFAYRFGAGLVILPDIAPAVSWGPVALVALERAGAWSLRLGVERTATGTMDTQPAATWARLSAARLGGCVGQLGPSWASVRPCLQLAGGVFEAGGIRNDAITRVRRIGRPWASLGGSLRAELRLSRQLVLAGEAAWLMPFVRQQLAFESPDAVVYQTGAISRYFGATVEFVMGRSKGAVPGIAR
ncbi:MAG: hypothetical protein ABUL60_06550 [Myxococcales bacterium]